LGAKAPLPKAFEKATALARRIDVRAVDDGVIEQLLVAAAERLRWIYDAQRTGRDLTAGALAEVEIEQIARSPRDGQGLRLSPEERITIERRAMVVARQWLETNGYAVVDRSRTMPFDFDATRDGISLKVEVKGTTADSVDAIFMTKNEVDLHRAERGRTALVLVSAIRVTNERGSVLATGGVPTALVAWNIDEWDVSPMAYRVRRPDH